ncbi:class I SAM-dependent methyltransferase [Sphingomonas sp. PR090111-T3T-6A]|uniref:class I SAM-dependent methyltransferase n=1 Tax=Sphingomonas sp. PR090111-T3T-6A TaxID=685778 RepID=UPI00037C0FA6|nr:class I SAM-dependent methyltransferase [Sphingomonas sp. PR090111-T3T-6A]
MLRDTDEDWKGIAGEPYYGVFSHLEYFRENLTPERLEHFWASGRGDIGWQLDLLRRHYGDFQPKSVIDFGCGVGRLSRALAEIVDQVYGIDVAEGMREEARKNVPANVQIFEAIDSVPAETVDWINSTIVFQHIHPANGLPLFQKLLDRLAPGGGMTVQFTTFKERGAVTMAGLGMDYVSWDGERMKALIETPPGSGTMMMYDYDLNQIMAMLYRAGIERFTIQHSNHGGHHGAFVIGRKG